MIILVGIVLVVSLLAAAGMRLEYINSQRLEMKLIANEPLKNAPPSLAFATVAMGAFRGLVVDVLWIRADRLKEEGQFFDAKQLAEWITTLQPRFAKVWEFQAWNMAYNISVAIPAEQPDQRWQWIKNGYELLRDKGIPNNPKSILLYRELGRIFQHKIGGITDDDQKYYKLQLALAMGPLLGPADPGPMSYRGVAGNDFFDALAEAPTEWSQVASDPNISPLITALKKADKAFEDNASFVSSYLSLRQNPARFDPAAFRVIDRFRGKKALENFDAFAKAYQLRSVWKLDPVVMRELNQTYGPVEDDPNIHYPLDWRHPDVHAIYWAIQGLRIAGNRPVKPSGKDRYSVDEENTDRIVAHSLQNLFRYGRIYIYDVQREQPSRPTPLSDPNAGVYTAKEIFLRPDLRMFYPYSLAITEIIPKYIDPNDLDFEDSHQVQMRNMFTNALFSFYQAGHIKRAQEIYIQLRELYPSRPEYRHPSVDVFARWYLKEELKNMSITNATEMIMMLLREAYFRYAMRDDDEAFGREKMAEEAYKVYVGQYHDEQRLQLPDFKLLRYNALLDFFNDQQYPVVLRQNLIARIRIERPELADQFTEIEQKFLQQVREQQSQ
ncbi:MAG: hypothetical protein JW749_08095 [Sedimentisphaerales bacterium]|nr:hypothetical protein [Sedimentisphaerales bacterium]